VLHGVQCVAHQVGAVEEGNHLHALGQNALVQLVHFLVNAIEDGVGVAAFLQQHNAFDGIGIVHDCAVWAMHRAANLAETNLGALRNGGDVLDLDGRAV